MRLRRLVLLLRLRLRLLLLDGRRQRHIVGQACTASCQAKVQPLGVHAPQYAAAPLPPAAEYGAIATSYEADQQSRTLPSFPQGAHEPEAHEPEACVCLCSRGPSPEKALPGICAEKEGKMVHTLLDPKGPSPEKALPGICAEKEGKMVRSSASPSGRPISVLIFCCSCPACTLARFCRCRSPSDSVSDSSGCARAQQASGVSLAVSVSSQPDCWLQSHHPPEDLLPLLRHSAWQPDPSVLSFLFTYTSQVTQGSHCSS